MLPNIRHCVYMQYWYKYTPIFLLLKYHLCKLIKLCIVIVYYMCYTSLMDNQIEILQPNEMINPNMTQGESSVKRIVAEAIRQAGQKELFSSYTNKNQTYAEFLALMLYDGVVEGVVTFADGTSMAVNEAPTEWLALVKFLASHSEGGVNQNAQFNGVNVFKIYRGIDDSRI